MAAIELQGVTKTFGQVLAVSDLDLTVNEGEIFGFLGPNGAGKTTTIDLMLDFIRPDHGEIRVLDRPVRTDPRAVRERTGVLPEGAAVWDRLTGRQHLEFAIESKGVNDDPAALLDRVGIPDAIDRKAGGYSKGMAQRLLLAIALVGEPDLLILDEPSTGLDPNGAREMRQIAREENERGATVFFSSHILGQVEAVCDRVGIMLDGQMVAVDSIEGLRQSMGGETTLRIRVDRTPDGAIAAVEEVPGVSTVSIDTESEGQVVIVRGDESKTAVLAALEDNGVEVIDFRTEETSLDELFHAYTTDGGVSV